MAADKKNWIVIASGDRPLTEISDELSGKGFKVGQVLEAIGQITGESDAEVSKDELQVAGVAEIVPMGGDIQLPGPEEDLSW
ncbi:hypothetical protein [Pseudocnuella soli]|uniref:hypothetical protein n=1 Tax=Pseudocnuella soli TaxID=2502779 RepID=UPI0010521590|nr:hypothetical protein [Pseudocnuella soli]